MKRISKWDFGAKKQIVMFTELQFSKINSFDTYSKKKKKSWLYGMFALLDTTWLR